MRRALPALGITAVGLGFLLSFETRGEESVELALGEATVEPTLATAAPDTTAPTASAPHPTPPASTAPASTAAPGTTPAPVPTTVVAPDSTAAGGSSSGEVVSGVVTGPVADTRFGPVQVEITVTDGVITDVRALQAPSQDRKSRAINQRAVPVYNAAALQAQSAEFDSVSGATVTWRAYTASLQAALDAAGM